MNEAGENPRNQKPPKNLEKIKVPNLSQSYIDKSKD
jgi:hypothetical protein